MNVKNSFTRNGLKFLLRRIWGYYLSLKRHCNIYTLTSEKPVCLYKLEDEGNRQKIADMQSFISNSNFGHINHFQVCVKESNSQENGQNQNEVCGV